jgi:hypothetical protein
VFLQVNVEKNYQLLQILLNLHIATTEVTAVFDEAKMNFKNNPPTIIQIAVVCSTLQTFTQTQSHLL